VTSVCPFADSPRLYNIYNNAPDPLASTGDTSSVPQHMAFQGVGEDAAAATDVAHRTACTVVAQPQAAPAAGSTSMSDSSRRQNRRSGGSCCSMTSGGVQCCRVTVPYWFMTCVFPCLAIFTRLTTKARRQAMHRTATLSQRKTKKCACLTIVAFVGLEAFDCGSDILVYFRTVQPRSDAIDRHISEGFVPVYLGALCISLVVSLVVLTARTGFVFCLVRGRGQMDKDSEYLLAVLNELCGAFLLLFEDLPFLVLHCLLILNGTKIIPCEVAEGVAMSSHGALDSDTCGERDARLRELMISFTLSSM
jgi:hypothetical protein